MKITLTPIGTIYSPHKAPEGTPIQPTAARGTPGTIILEPEFVPGLDDLDGFSYLILLYYFDRVTQTKLKVRPFLDDQPHGVFATRAPVRPNRIGLSIVRLTRIDGRTLYLEDVDILDGTPLLDIKPYVDRFDRRISENQGWLEKNIAQLAGKTADGRFSASN